MTQEAPQFRKRGNFFIAEETEYSIMAYKCRKHSDIGNLNLNFHRKQEIVRNIQEINKCILKKEFSLLRMLDFYTLKGWEGKIHQYQKSDNCLDKGLILFNRQSNEYQIFTRTVYFILSLTHLV